MPFFFYPASLKLGCFSLELAGVDGRVSFQADNFMFLINGPVSTFGKSNYALQWSSWSGESFCFSTNQQNSQGSEKIWLGFWAFQLPYFGSVWAGRAWGC